MKPTETLRAEHEVILRLLDVLEAFRAEAEKHRSLEAADAGKIVALLRGFADARHHAKEETLLFRRLHEMGWPLSGGPIAVMLHEHERGRDLTRRMADAAANGSESWNEFAAAAADYGDLLHRHIHKENNILFPRADDGLDPDGQRSLQAAFEAADALRPGEMESAVKQIEDLTEKYGAAPRPSLEGMSCR